MVICSNLGPLSDITHNKISHLINYQIPEFQNLEAISLSTISNYLENGEEENSENPER